MKSHKFVALLVAAGIYIGTSLTLQANENLHLGDSPPMANVEMKGVDGEAHTIAGVKGEKGTLVMFSCNACPWVKKWEDRIAGIGNTYQKKGFGVIVINANDPDRVAEDSYDEMIKRTRARGFEFPYVVDATSDVARAFGATRTPEVFLFDSAGKLVYHGAIDDNAHNADKVEAAYLKNALDAVLVGKSVTQPQTKALGCSIKFRNKT